MKKRSLDRASETSFNTDYVIIFNTSVEYPSVDNGTTLSGYWRGWSTDELSNKIHPLPVLSRKRELESVLRHCATYRGLCDLLTRAVLGRGWYGPLRFSRISKKTATLGTIYFRSTGK